MVWRSKMTIYSVWQMFFNLFALKDIIRAVVPACWICDTQSFCWKSVNYTSFFFPDIW